MEFLGYDANGTDGSDLSKMTSIYLYRGREVRIPASTPPNEVLESIWEVLGLNPTEERQRLADLNTLRGENGQSLLDQIDADLALIASATAAQVKQIVGRLLERQRAIIQASRHLAERE
jgi:hypothetical protein